MHLNDPWKELYKNWSARDNREEYRAFMKWAREYEVSHLCVRGGDANAGK